MFINYIQCLNKRKYLRILDKNKSKELYEKGTVPQSKASSEENNLAESVTTNLKDRRGHTRKHFQKIDPVVISEFHYQVQDN